ncbi:MAG TPA: hypothetical protein VMT89_07645 [Candidatus Acidoferrales bacterium]|nr:hypothetical protein [Candidatus Acidoferrales bacterium]
MTGICIDYEPGSDSAHVAEPFTIRQFGGAEICTMNAADIRALMDECRRALAEQRADLIEWMKRQTQEDDL